MRGALFIVKVKYLNEALILGENENGFRANPSLPLSGTFRQQF